MTDAVEKGSITEKSSESSLHVYVIGVIAALFAGMLAYQFLFCAGCYM